MASYKQVILDLFSEIRFSEAFLQLLLINWSQSDFSEEVT